MTRSRIVWLLVAAGVGFGLGWAVGLDLSHAAALAVAAVILVELRKVSWFTEDEGWPERDLGPTDQGVRRDIARLSWGMDGFQSRVDRASVNRLRGVAVARLARLGVDLDDPSDREQARALLGAPSYGLLISGTTDLPTFAVFAAAVTAVEQLNDKELTR